MIRWPATKAKRVLAALLRRGWRIVKTRGSHRFLAKPGHRLFLFAFHDNQELGPAALSWISKDTGLKPDDL